ncbi:MAG: hypothetical protein H6559_22065 [Lewinellaceae bacterium]|nr:hypothetical protein [Lewinellaceae bacterium]
MKRNLLIILLLLGSAWGVVHGQNFEVYVSDAAGFTTGPWKILKFDQNGENGEVFTDQELAWPQDIVFLDHRNSVIVSNLNTNKITEYNAETGEYIGDFATGIGGPTRMKVGQDSLLYVLQWSGNGRVLRYDLDGNFVDAFTDANVSNSIGLDWDIHGNLYVSSYNSRYVQQFSSTGENMGRFVNSNLSGPTNIWFDEEGNLLVVDYLGGAVKKFDAAGNYLGIFMNNLQFAEGVDFFPNGDILIGEGQTSSVKRYDSEGNFIEAFIPGGTLGLMTPNAVVLRELGVSPVREAIRQVEFITPTVGVEFYIADPLNAADLKSIEVYGIKGQLLANRAYTGNTVAWNAAGAPDGMYVIVGRLKDGTSWSQKVAVRK